jgi:hypothetical protein
MQPATFLLPALLLAVLAAPGMASTETLVDMVRAVPRPAAGSVESAVPSATDRAAFATQLAGLLQETRPPPTVAGYRTVTIAEDGRRLRALLPTRPGFSPIVIVAEAPLRDVIIEAPHPEKDRETGAQAALLLARLGARAAIISAHDRCAAQADSPCSGRTAVCGGRRRAYPDSDPAHNPSLLFHAAHERLVALWPAAVVVQLHGFRGRGSDTLFIISDGSGEKRPGDRALVGRIRDRIRSTLDDGAAAVDCQDPDDRRIRFPRLCARTNVQGRALNGSNDICRRNAPVPSGRFLHIEQDWSVREPLRRDWRDATGDRRLAALLRALAAELPCLAPGCGR